jgi:Zn-dependent membrane protease YugP
MFMFFDPMYFLFLIPGMLLAAWAQWRVRSAFSEASQIAPSTGVSGAEAAAEILQSNGINGVQIGQAEGYLSDHYDPTEKTLALSPDVYGQRSLAAVGVAAHEVGHAIQDSTHYPLLVMRNVLVPVASFGSSAAFPIMMLGFGLAYAHMFFLAKWLIYAGIAAFSIAAVFQVVNLPVEFDASRRARIALQETGLVTPAEDETVGKVLNAAALTYVAATLTAILTMLYFLFRSGLLGGRRD